MKIQALLLFLVFGIAPAFGQKAGANTALEKGEDYLRRSEEMAATHLDSFFYYRQLALPFFKEAQAWESYIDCINGFANYYYQTGEFEIFQKTAKEGVALAKQYLKDNNGIYGFALNNYGIALKQLGDYERALDYYQESLKIDLSHNTDKNSLAYSYANIGSNFRRLGDYTEAINYLDQAINLQADTFGYRHYKTAYTQLSKGHCQRDMQNWRAALATYKTAISSLEASQRDGNKNVVKRLIYGYQSMAKVFLHLSRQDSTAYYIEKAMYWQKQGYEGKMILSHEILGDWNSQKGNLQSALKNYTLAYEWSLKKYHSFDKHYTKAHHQKMIGETLFKMGKTDEALAAYQKALIYLAFDFSDTSAFENPAIESMLSPRKGLEIIVKKAEAFAKKYQSSGDIKQLETAFKHFSFCTDIIRELRKNIYRKESKYNLAGKILPVYEGGIAASLALYQQNKNPLYLETAFSFAEQNKAILLLQSLQSDKALNKSNISQAELERERQVGIEINYWQKKINKYRQKKKDLTTETFKQWQNKLFELQQEYKNLIARFEKEHPRYYQLKHDTRPVSIKDLRATIIGPETALLEYFVGQEKSFLFFLTSDDFQIFQIDQADELAQNIQTLRQVISVPPDKNTFDTHLQILRTQAWQLSEQLLSPALSVLPTSVKRLIIVPDDQLAYLPFEVLLSREAAANPQDFTPATFPYLFNDFEISYNYSTTLLYNNFDKKTPKNLKPFLGFAPSFDTQNPRATARRSCSDGKVFSLLCNTDEVNNIHSLLGGHSYLNEEASSEAFLQNAADYRIIHLATHACSSPQDITANKIFFSDDYLGNIDLQNLQLHAELTVLSACNTGSGKLIPGEGVMSLSREFILAGCPSILMSLWSVDDCSTSDLMLHYYQNLKKGLRKDQALQLAKKHHLSQADKTQAHPYFWAAFVQSGNAEAIHFSDGWSTYWWLIGLGLLLILGLGIWAKR